MEVSATEWAQVTALLCRQTLGHSIISFGPHDRPAKAPDTGLYIGFVDCYKESGCKENFDKYDKKKLLNETACPNFNVQQHVSKENLKVIYGIETSICRCLCPETGSGCLL